MFALSKTKSYQKLIIQKNKLSNKKIVDLVKHDFASKIIESEDLNLTLDFSKNLIDQKTLQLLISLVKENNLTLNIQKMLNGELINNTEKKQVFHLALRQNAIKPLIKDRKIIELIETEKRKIQKIADKINNGSWLGYDNQAITDIVNIGIGGSYLGPKMVVNALFAYKNPKLEIHFLANVDYSETYNLLNKLKPATTLFIISSKSMSTIETITSTKTVISWFRKYCVNLSKTKNHFVAITAKPELLKKFEVNFAEVVKIWDWVGGRFSVFSGIGLTLAIAIGFSNFNKFLAGGEKMDKHFCQTDFSKNMPVILALLTFWYSQFWGKNNQAVLSYHHGLRFFSEYYQQLDMESNGKHVTKNGSTLNYSTAGIIWGGEGTNGQHSYHQLLHQGTSWTPIDFILLLKADLQNSKSQEHQNILVACALAQANCLMTGLTEQQAYNQLIEKGNSKQQAEFLAKHQALEGNRPSNLILIDQLTPQTLGSLIALYEHKTIVLGWLWQINSFDQWGVELGKVISDKIITRILSNESDNKMIRFDESTEYALKKYKKL